jgi:exonuclease SbcC
VIVTRVRVHPFGCFADRTLDLAPGLNVVLGPNEAGKSTLFKALRHALLVRTRLKKPELAKYLAPYLPAGGGDFIRVELDLLSPEGRFHLQKRWGSSPDAELTLPGGGVVAEEAAIQARVAELLPAKPATFATMLLVGQAELGATVDTLRGGSKEASDSLADLADTLRRVVLETGGVSVDRFTARLDELRNKAFSKWDIAHGGPERDGSGRSRGLENPWKNERGRIYEAWLRAETLRDAWNAAVAFEAGLDEVNAGLREAASALAKCESFVTTGAAAARDAWERRSLDAESGRLRAEAEQLRQLNREWPVAARRAEELREGMAKSDAARAPLTAELEAAQRAEEGRSLRERFERAQKLAVKEREARANLEAAPRLDRKALEEIQRANTALERAQAGLEAGRLSVTIAARANVQLVVQEDLDPEKPKSLEPGATASLKAGGRIRIQHPDMEIEVRSGDADFDARVQKAAAARRALTELLERHRIADRAEAETRAQAFATLEAELAVASRNLAEELAGAALQELEKQVAARGPGTHTRATSVVSAALARLEAERDALAAESERLNPRIHEWEAAHGSMDGLVDRIAAALSRQKDLQARIDACAPLPRGFADADTFLRDYEAAKERLTELKVERKGLETRKNDLEKPSRDQTAEEIAAQLKDGEEAFQSELRRGRALERVREHATELLRHSDSEIYRGMREALESAVSGMTGGRHARVEMDGALPRGLTDARGPVVGWEMLSAGTKDTLALALRLAMASYFLGDADGFMLLDDPLVDMDPGRQRAAAEALKTFSSSRQLIVFTCHPAVAELLGGNLVRLGAEE